MTLETGARGYASALIFLGIIYSLTAPISTSSIRTRGVVLTEDSYERNSSQTYNDNEGDSTEEDNHSGSDTLEAVKEQPKPLEHTLFYIGNAPVALKYIVGTIAAVLIALLGWWVYNSIVVQKKLCRLSKSMIIGK